jgi:preprotein translocase subunit SecF
MANETPNPHVYRELIQPGTHWEFINRRRTWFTISIILVALSIAMLPINHFWRGSILNWTIDFKGGTEIVVTFAKDKKVDQHAVRTTLAKGGFPDVEVNTFEIKAKTGSETGYLLRLAKFGAVSPADAHKFSDAFAAKFADRAITRATWSGDTFYVNSEKEITSDEFAAAMKAAGYEMKPWSAEKAKDFAAVKQGTNEHHYQVPVYGLERNVQAALEKGLATQVEIRQVDGVGAKAGAELRNDGIKSLLYAIALIMLYIAFRFDFRYGPGTVASLLHDAILVVGVFAVTWTEFSLTTVAAVLTVIGYSMNDTVVVFDRIRENEAKLKDKRLDRVINISVNETLSRTILTSMTTFVVTLAMNVLGTGLVKNFAFAMNIGIIVGTYSSIFVAAPILLWLHEHYYSKRPATSRRRLKPVEAEA